MKQGFTEEALMAIGQSEKAARYCRQNYVGTEHLLAGLLKTVQGTASIVLSDAGIMPEKLMKLIDRLIAPQGTVAVIDNQKFSPRAQAILDESLKIAGEFNS